MTPITNNCVGRITMPKQFPSLYDVTAAAARIRYYSRFDSTLTNSYRPAPENDSSEVHVTHVNPLSPAGKIQAALREFRNLPAEQQYVSPKALAATQSVNPSAQPDAAPQPDESDRLDNEKDKKASKATDGVGMSINWYDVLGLKQVHGSYAHYTAKDIRQAFRDLAVKTHSDKRGKTEASDKEFKLLYTAYDILFNADSRQAFDKELLKSHHASSMNEDLFLVSHQNSAPDEIILANDCTELVDYNSDIVSPQAYNLSEMIIYTELDPEILLDYASGNPQLALAFLNSGKIQLYLTPLQRYQLLLQLISSAADDASKLQALLNESAIKTLLSKNILKEVILDFVGACLNEPKAAELLLTTRPKITKLLSRASCYSLACAIPSLLNMYLTSHGDKLSISELIPLGEKFGVVRLTLALEDTGSLGTLNKYKHALKVNAILKKPELSPQDTDDLRKIATTFDLDFFRYFYRSPQYFKFRLAAYDALLSLTIEELTKLSSKWSLEDMDWVLNILSSVAKHKDTLAGKKEIDLSKSAERLLSLVKKDIRRYFDHLLEVNLQRCNATIQDEIKEALLARDKVTGEYYLLNLLNKKDKGDIKFDYISPDTILHLLKNGLISTSILFQLDSLFIKMLGEFPYEEIKTFVDPATLINTPALYKAHLKNQEYKEIKIRVGLPLLINTPALRHKHFKTLIQDPDLEQINPADKTYLKAIQDLYDMRCRNVSINKLQELLSAFQAKPIPFELTELFLLTPQALRKIIAALLLMGQEQVSELNLSEVRMRFIDFIKGDESTSDDSILLIKILNRLFNDPTQWDTSYLIQCLFKKSFFHLEGKFPTVLSQLIMYYQTWNIIIESLKKENVPLLNKLNKIREAQVAEIDAAFASFDPNAPSESINNIVTLIQRYGFYCCNNDEVVNKISTDARALLAHRILELTDLYLPESDKKALIEYRKDNYKENMVAKFDLDIAKSYLRKNKDTISDSAIQELIDSHGDAFIDFIKANEIDLWNKFTQRQQVKEKLDAAQSYRLKHARITPQHYEKQLFALIEQVKLGLDLKELLEQVKQFSQNIPPSMRSEAVRKINDLLELSPESIDLVSLLIQCAEFSNCVNAIKSLQDRHIISLLELAPTLLLDPQNIPGMIALAMDGIFSLDDIVKWSLDEGTHNLCQYIKNHEARKQLETTKILLINRLRQYQHGKYEADHHSIQPLPLNDIQAQEVGKLLCTLVTEGQYYTAQLLLTIAVNPDCLDIEAKDFLSKHYEDQIFCIIQDALLGLIPDKHTFNQRMEQFLSKVPLFLQSETLKGLKDALVPSPYDSVTSLLIQCAELPRCLSTLQSHYRDRLHLLVAACSDIAGSSKYHLGLLALVVADILNIDNLVSWGLDSDTQLICQHITNHKEKAKLQTTEVYLMTRAIQYQADRKNNQPLELTAAQMQEAEKILFTLVAKHFYEAAMTLIVLGVKLAYRDEETNDSLLHLLVQQANAECHPQAESSPAVSALDLAKFILVQATIASSVDNSHQYPPIITDANANSLLPVELAYEPAVIEIFAQRFTTNATDDLHYNAVLYQQLIQCDFQTAKLLITAGADPTAHMHSNAGNSIWHMFAMNKDFTAEKINTWFTLFQYWLDKTKATENTAKIFESLLLKPNWEGLTPIDIAIRQNAHEAVDTFLGKLKWSPLHYAAWKADLVSIEAQIKLNADIWALDHKQRSPIRLAHQHGNWEVIDCFLANIKFDDRNKNRLGEVLRWAVDENQPEAAQKLLSEGVTMTWQSPEHQMPLLHMAIRNQNSDMVKLLLAHMSPAKVFAEENCYLGKTVLVSVIELQNNALALLANLQKAPFLSAAEIAKQRAVVENLNVIKQEIDAVFLKAQDTPLNKAGRMIFNLFASASKPKPPVVNLVLDSKSEDKDECRL